jgi:hypothetical protein
LDFGSSESGIVLVITLILLSVITFMAITLLVVTRAQKGTVTTSYDQTTAGLAADTGAERAKMAILAPMIAQTNPYNFNFFVSTNYINTFGFVPNNSSPTNVNYDYTATGARLTAAQQLQNLENLLYDPRPPVWVTNRAYRSNEFRFYRDENRDGLFEPTGLQPVIGFNGVPLGTFDYFVGDPQWVGVLERPGLPHSSTNRFLSRFAYSVIPLSKTLDVNYIYDYAKGLSPGLAQGSDSFFRNMGVGTWEINLAAFLVDLNTNFWQPPASPYAYYGLPSNYLQANSGVAFEDALSLLSYRYSSPPGALRWARPPIMSVAQLFGAAGVNAFTRDFVDGYTHGPPMVGTSLIADNDGSRVNFGWSGSDNPNHFFSSQDFFDRAKTTVNWPSGVPASTFSFAERLLAASSRTNSYDRYTFARLQAQLGTDSSPETGKLNLNYVNVDNFGNVSPNMATNFIPWNAEQFFTNAAMRLMVNAGYSVGTYARNVPYSPTNILTTTVDGLSTNFSIQVWPTNYYTPSVHRLLQLAANVYDATTNRTFGVGGTNGFPSVFRPIFYSDTKNNRVFIVGFREVVDSAIPIARPGMLDLNVPGDRQRATPGNLVMAYGVPLIVGAKKGFPNFNEFSMQTAVNVTRKIQILAQTGKPASQVRAFATNQMYVVTISNVFGLEAWNSYSNAFPRDLRLYAYLDMSGIVSNEFGHVFNPPNGASIQFSTNFVLAANSWKGFKDPNSAAVSFRMPLAGPGRSLNNFNSLVPSTYSFRDGIFEAPPARQFEQNQNPPLGAPHWLLRLTTRLRFLLVDTSVNRIVDYVNLSSVDDPVDITYELMKDADCSIYNPGSTTAIDGLLWCTNRATPLGPTAGERLQIDISLGTFPADWRQYAISEQQFHQYIDFFRSNFYGWPAKYGNTVFQTNDFAALAASRTIYITTSWQANDPLVHYTVGDLLDLQRQGTNRVARDNIFSQLKISNIGRINDRYEPWGGNPTGGSSSQTKTLVSVKDPLVTRSDDWDFPTNKFPNIGWLGRVHRGTPWQTVYLKPYIESTNWLFWSGNNVLVTNFGQFNTNIFNLPLTVRFPANSYTNDAFLTHPTNDWAILDLFTTAFNDNAARGRLGINQTNLAAWSAVLSGVIALQADTNSGLSQTRHGTNFVPVVIQPVGLSGNASPLLQIVNGINNSRTRNYGGAFRKLGDILSAPELTVNSPFVAMTNAGVWSVNDAVVERIPQQVLSLLSLDTSPRFLIYSYGQSLKPANRSIVTSGQFFGLCTNYQVTAETATRTLLRVDGLKDNPPNPRIVIEKFNYLPPD